MTPTSILLKNDQCPGDHLMLTAAVRDLKLQYPDIRINVAANGANADIWKNNPYLDRTITANNADRVVEAHYPLIQYSDTHPFHFIHGFRQYLQSELRLTIPPRGFWVDLHFTEQEKAKPPFQLNTRYWILNAGGKKDFTNKQWEYDRFQQVVDALKGEVTFVQIGYESHWHKHPKLKNVVSLVGKTSLRQALTLIYHSAGVLTGVSFPLLAASMEGPPERIRTVRPCVCIAGGREPVQWQQMRGTQFLHTCCMLDCNAKGGCWKSRVLPLYDGKPQDKSLCAHPVKTSSGQIVPMCMDWITVDEVVAAVRRWETGWKMSNS